MIGIGKKIMEFKSIIGHLVKKNVFVKLVKKSPHIPRAIAKLSGLNVFLSSVEGVGP